MRLAVERIVLAQKTLGDAGLERHVLGPRRIVGRQHRDADLPRGLDDKTGAGLSRNASLGGAQHVNRILTLMSSLTIPRVPIDRALLEILACPDDHHAPV